MLPGVKVHDLKKNLDERGFFAEIIRQDWADLLGEDTLVKANLSYSYPGMIRAWHRHNRGQVDYFIVVQGWMKICAYDDRKGSEGRMVTKWLGSENFSDLRKRPSPLPELGFI